MKYLTILLFLMASNCSTNKINLPTTKENLTNNWCPEDGKCVFTKLEQTKLILKFDEFGNSYTEITKGENTVLKFEYTRVSNDQIEDSSYKELVWIELTDLDRSFTALDGALKNYNTIFTRLCFCRGQTGSYALDKGEINYTSNENEKHIKFTFNNSKVPQVLNFVETSF
jgi:hypothetical protein